MEATAAASLLGLSPEVGTDGVQAELRRRLQAIFAEEARAVWPDDDAATTDEPDAPPPLTFLPRGRPSLAVPGELGLFASGACDAGTLVALYPGVVYDSSDLPMMHTHLLAANGFVIARRDGVLIDGRQTAPSSTVFAMAQAREAAAGRTPLAALAANPWARGHYANHPPEGVADSVALYPLDLTATHLDAIGWRWLPNVNFRPPAAGDWALRTVVLIALRPLAHGAELFLDYRLDSDAAARPPWYSKVQRPAKQQRLGGCDEASQPGAAQSS
jgi:hypothetical protein